MRNEHEKGAFGIKPSADSVMNDKNFVWYFSSVTSRLKALEETYMKVIDRGFVDLASVQALGEIQEICFVWEGQVQSSPNLLDMLLVYRERANIAIACLGVGDEEMIEWANIVERNRFAFEELYALKYEPFYLEQRLVNILKDKGLGDFQLNTETRLYANLLYELRESVILSIKKVQDTHPKLYNKLLGILADTDIEECVKGFDERIFRLLFVGHLKSKGMGVSLQEGIDDPILDSFVEMEKERSLKLDSLRDMLPALEKKILNLTMSQELVDKQAIVVVVSEFVKKANETLYASGLAKNVRAQFDQMVAKANRLFDSRYVSRDLIAVIRKGEFFVNMWSSVLERLGYREEALMLKLDFRGADFRGLISHIEVSGIKLEWMAMRMEGFKMQQARIQEISEKIKDDHTPLTLIAVLDSMDVIVREVEQMCNKTSEIDRAIMKYFREQYIKKS